MLFISSVLKIGSEHQRVSIRTPAETPKILNRALCASAI